MSEEKYINVKKIIEISNGKLIYGNENIICKNFSKDTRTINKDDTYLGIKGESFNGSNFYIDALEKGASVCILQDVEVDIQKINKYFAYKRHIFILNLLYNNHLLRMD